MLLTFNQLIQSNDTRWNSQYVSIGRALNCRKRIQDYQSNYDIGDCEPLTHHDWKVLEKVHSVLESYYAATMCCQGRKVHIGKWFPTLDFLFSRNWDTLCHFRKLKEDNPDRPEYTWLEAAANSAWLKCEQYYQRADESAAYYAGEVLQPNRKWAWLHQEWSKDPEKQPWLHTVKKAVQQLWNEEYKGKSNPSSTQKETNTLVSRPKHSDRQSESDNEFALLSQHWKIKNIESLNPTNIDAFRTYIERDPEGLGEGLIDYWNSRILSQPDLARFALDILAVPISSDECERIFSSAKLLITPSRNRLNADIIEANECLRAWFGRPEEREKKKVEDGDKVEQKNEDKSWGEMCEDDSNEDGEGESDGEAGEDGGDAPEEYDEESDSDDE